MVVFIFIWLLYMFGLLVFDCLFIWYEIKNEFLEFKFCLGEVGIASVV